MPSAGKIKWVSDFKEKIQSTNEFVVTGYSGLDASQMTQLRMQLRKEGLELKVVKNSLFAIALKETGYDDTLPTRLHCPMAVIFSKREMVSELKVIHKLTGEYNALSLLWGVLEGRLYEQAQLQELAKIPSRDELLSHLVSYLMPIHTVSTVIYGTLWEFVMVLNAVVKNKETSLKGESV